MGKQPGSNKTCSSAALEETWGRAGEGRGEVPSVKSFEQIKVNSNTSFCSSGKGGTIGGCIYQAISF